MTRLALAIGGAAALVLTAYAASVLDAAFGWPRGLLAVGAVYGACGLLSRTRPRRAPSPSRPADDVQVTKPRPLARTAR